jgi:hypothetical protein
MGRYGSGVITFGRTTYTIESDGVILHHDPFCGDNKHVRIVSAKMIRKNRHAKE